MGTKKHAHKSGLNRELTRADIGSIAILQNGARYEIEAKGSSYRLKGQPQGFTYGHAKGKIISNEEHPHDIARVERHVVRSANSQGTFLNVWKEKGGKLATSIHDGRKNADSATRTKAKRIGVIRYSRRKGLEVVS